MGFPTAVILGPQVTLTSSSIARAAALARSWQSEIVMVRSLDTSLREFTDLELKRDRERLFGSLAAALSFGPVQAVHTSGDPAAGFAAVAGTTSSVVVVGPGNEPSAPSSGVLRRTTINVTERAQRSVLVARSNSSQPRAYSRLLFLLDQNEKGASALVKAAELFSPAEVYLLKRYTRPFPGLLGSIVSDEELREDAADEMEEWLERNDVPREVCARMHRIIGEGESHRLVERFARTYAADLIVLPLTAGTRYFLDIGVLSGGGPFARFGACDFFLCPP